MSSPPSPTSFRSLVLPREHGSWSLALEPVALGLLVAPSPAGAWLALAVVAGFFTRRPLKLAVTLPTDDARRSAAARWTLLFALAALGALLTVAFASHADLLRNTLKLPGPLPGDNGPEFALNTQQTGFALLWPLLLAAPCGAAFLWFDLRDEMREAEAELAGSAAFAIVPAAFATLAGWSTPQALALAALALARSAPTVLVVRAYLRRAKGGPASGTPAAIAAACALGGVLGLVAGHLVPRLAAGIAFVHFVRSLWLLSPFAPHWSARRLGASEAGLGVGSLAGLAWAYHALWLR